MRQETALKYTSFRVWWVLGGVVQGYAWAWIGLLITL
jgi:hypothetical protein